MTTPGSAPEFLPLAGYRRYPEEEMLRRAAELAAGMARRRTVRQFSDRPVPRALVETLLAIAGTAPSGANLQPWHFVAVSDPVRKREIRLAAEEEERDFYRRRAPREWLEALAPLGTDENKPYLETAPWLIAIFAQRYGILPGGRTRRHYYVSESVGIATGFLVAAAHLAGLVSLTHTPSPMSFLNRLLDRPRNEAPFLILVLGYPADEARVPRLGKKALGEIASFR
jgi:nitroreductase